MAKHDNETGLSGLVDILKGVGKLINTAADAGVNSRSRFTVKLGLDKEDGITGIPGPVYCVPQAGVFKDVDRLTVILELPEVEEDSLCCRIDGQLLVIEASSKDVSYRKEIGIDNLNVSLEGMSITENNGIFKLELKTGNGEAGGSQSYV